MDYSQIFVDISLMALPLLLGVTLHEAGHAYAAYYLGDDTAKRAGRLSLNPLVHVDKVGTIIVPIAMKLLGAPFMFGWAKPVPVNVGRLRNPRRDSIIVSLAGPSANLILAVAAGFLLSIVGDMGYTQQDWAYMTLIYMVYLNCLLGVLNLLPIPPLDGGHVLMDILPLKARVEVAKIAPFGFFIVIGMLMLAPGVLMIPTRFIAGLIFGMMG
jgi:Zn-dependent protease